MSENHISRKKPSYPINNPLMDYLRKYSRELNTHAALRNELLKMGWADWMEFSYQDNNVVYGVIRSKL